VGVSPPSASHYYRRSGGVDSPKFISRRHCGKALTSSLPSNPRRTLPQLHSWDDLVSKGDSLRVQVHTAVNMEPAAAPLRTKMPVRQRTPPGLDTLPPELISQILSNLIPGVPEIGETRPVSYEALIPEEPWCVPFSIGTRIC
jgi:hypothetical protein